MQPSSSDSLRPCGSFSEKNSSAKPKTDLNSETPSLTLQCSYPLSEDGQDAESEGFEVKRLFARMRLCISSLVDELHGRETTISGLLIELLIGSEVVVYELDDEITSLCAEGNSAETRRDKCNGNAIARRASALSRVRHRVLVLQRSLKVLLESTSPMLEKYSASISYSFQPFEMEGKGVVSVYGPFRRALELGIDVIALTSGEAVKSRDFHGGAVLAALASNLNDFSVDLKSMMDALPELE